MEPSSPHAPRCSRRAAVRSLVALPLAALLLPAAGCEDYPESVGPDPRLLWGTYRLVRVDGAAVPLDVEGTVVRGRLESGFMAVDDGPNYDMNLMVRDAGGTLVWHRFRGRMGGKDRDGLLFQSLVGDIEFEGRFQRPFIVVDSGLGFAAEFYWVDIFRRPA
jgi:hypothetical protein